MRYKFVFGALLLAVLAGCAMQPDGLKTIEHLDTARYMGNWYEIARLDHGFERGLQRVSATYVLRDDGTVGVTNRGFDPESGEWREANGTARFRDGVPNGKLKVSFFGPFYGGYNIVELDADYRYALILGPDPDYAWILARENSIEEPLYRRLLARAREIGVAEDAWIRVEHR